jgi:hypothetical protein
MSLLHGVVNCIILTPLEMQVVQNSTLKQHFFYCTYICYLAILSRALASYILQEGRTDYSHSGK